MEVPLTQYIRAGERPLTLSEYDKAGGYRAVHKALKEMTPDEIITVVRDANLLGRGGAGFPTGLKWSLVPKKTDNDEPRYLLANADEMEPGAFKDRYLLEGNPHQLLAGIIIAAYAIQAGRAFIFIRWAYKKAEKYLRQAIAEAYEEGYLGRNILGTGFNLDVYIHVSTGRYMCGEETGLINSIEGKRANPRSKPPFPATLGTFGKPSIVNNVETLSFIPHIVENGAEWFRKLSITGEGGTRLYGVSGRVKKPGLWELPLGITMRELLDVHAGGMIEGYQFRGAIPGGASTDFVMESHLDTPMDFASYPKVGSRLGTATVTVLDDKSCPVKFIHNMLRFFALESCGWCTPCREGLPWVEKLLRSIEEGTGKEEDLEILRFHTTYLGPGNTFCALAPGAVEPLQSGLKYFHDDFMRHINEKRCPWKQAG
jgi:NADH-quinone oxidoreductase subunit F